MSDQLFRSSHPGIPRQWTLIGEGGNACVWSDGSQAIKRLKEGASREAVSRFKREAEILLTLNEHSGLRIVPVQEVREREGALEIVMARMDGSLEKAITSFAGNPERAAAALEPIASTLAVMAARPEPIFHRDLKPTNLLFKASPDHLYLADFGCAFLAEDERLTPAKRAMGAWAYRPPEYSVGRLTDVTEKGDVFSLGKVLWAMINGEPGVVFPGPVWFGPEYDLGRGYPSHPRIYHAMLAVSNAVAINPADRPSLKQLADILSNLSLPQPSSDESDTMIALLRAQSVIEVEYEQRRAATAAFVRALHRDLHQSVADLAQLAQKVGLAWISTDWNPSNAGFGKGFRRLRISALSVIRYGELITRVHAVSFASATILGESGTPRFRCIDLRRMPASWRSQVSWFNSRLTPDMANDTAHMCLSDHYMN